jgi:hypothetical protein
MDFNLAISEVSVLRDHLYRDPDKYVQRWSSQQCRDYQVPLIRLIHLLNGGTEVLRVRSDPESLAIRDIIEKSELQQLLEFDVSSQVIQFRSDSASTKKKVISDLLISRASALAD